MKVVEGQLQFWGMVSDLSRVSNSMASQNMRKFISLQVEQQAFAPDVLPTRVVMGPPAESGNGALVNSVG